MSAALADDGRCTDRLPLVSPCETGEIVRRPAAGATMTTPGLQLIADAGVPSLQWRRAACRSRPARPRASSRRRIRKPVSVPAEVSGGARNAIAVRPGRPSRDADAADPAQSAVRAHHDAARRRAAGWRSSIAACSAATTAPRVVDLLFHLPTGAIDRRARPKLRDVVPDTVVTVAVTVDRHRPPPPNRPRAPYQVYASDDDRRPRPHLLQRAHGLSARSCCRSASGATCSGTVGLYDGMLQMVHPDRVVAEAGSRQAAAGRAGLSADRRA